MSSWWRVWACAAVVAAACSNGHGLQLNREVGRAARAETTSTATAAQTPIGTVITGPISDRGAGANPRTARPVEGTPAPGAEVAASKIRHVIVIMQENRSFDTYFGTFPGAHGFPAKNGRFTVCVPDPRARSCQFPYHLSADSNGGGPHTQSDAQADIDGGRMDGFIAQDERGTSRGCGTTDDPQCTSASKPDVMGYHDAREIPNYWTWAQQFVLQDNLFEPNQSWSLPEHLFLVSEWSARCATPQPISCRNDVESPDNPPDFGTGGAATSSTRRAPNYAWTDLTYLLHKHHVSWRYYIQSGTQPDCADDLATCAPVHQDATTPGIWNPLPYFETVRQDGELGNVVDVSQYYRDARAGTLPAVAWITPSDPNSEHPPAKVSDGQAWVTSLVDAAMAGPEWDTTAIFLSWDDWGGFYDHVPPPAVDDNGYGLRVPGLVLGAYARAGMVDHQLLSHDAYAKLIEDLFLGGSRIDPANDGRPDPRPDVREGAPQLGSLLSDFDFSQRPRPPVPLAVHPPPGPASSIGSDG